MKIANEITFNLNFSSFFPFLSYIMVANLIATTTFLEMRPIIFLKNFVHNFLFLMR